MNLQFSKLLPGGNPTILVESPVVPKKRAAVANILMGQDYLNADQVGFIVEPQNANNADVRLEMMGGELCINALRSVAALLFSRDSSRKVIRLESSGADGIFECTSELSNGQIVTSIRCKTPLALEKMEGGTLVQLNGISHLVQQVEKLPAMQEQEKEFRSILERNKNMADLSACGFIPYIEAQDVQPCMPLVYVRNTQSMIFESACGSGSIAAALYRYAQNNLALTSQIIQPSGVEYSITLDPQPSGEINVSLTSPVTVIANGIVSISSSLL